MEILTYNTKEGTAIIKQGINIHKTRITPEIQEIIDKHTKKQPNKENTKTTTKQKNNKKQQKQDKNTKKQQEN